MSIDVLLHHIMELAFFPFVSNSIFVVLPFAFLFVGCLLMFILRIVRRDF